MVKRSWLCMVCVTLAGFAHLTTAQPAKRPTGLVDYVDPLSGTAPSTSFAALAHSEAGSERSGNTIPAVGLPFGMTQFTPQTISSEKKCVPPYEYKAKLFRGFRASHWLSGSCTQDYGSFTVLPVVGKLTDSSALLLDHQNERATPYEYQIYFPKKYKARMTATLRSAIWEITMLTTDTLHLLIRSNSDFNQGKVLTGEDPHIISGLNPAHRIYQGWGEYAGFDGNFYLRIQNSPSRVQKSENFADSGLVISSYYLKKGETLRFKMGTSFTSIKAARHNLQSEIADWNYQKIKKAAIQSWEKHLGHIRVYSNNKRDARIFYTSLYHAFQQPRLFSDVNGSYPAFDGDDPSGKAVIKQLDNGAYYDDFSLWDIYRAQLPLMMLIEPATVNDFVRSILLKSQQGGWTAIFPCWNNYTAAMIGDHVAPFVAAAYKLGIRDYSLEALYPYLRKNAFDTSDQSAYMEGKGRRALKSYLKYGYVPLEDSVNEAFHRMEQVSRTLEYSYDDYALGQLAFVLGKKNDAAFLSKRARNYKNVIDPVIGMARGRYIGGNWTKDFTPYQRATYITEGTPAQYSFYVPQDIKGLADLMGGEGPLEERLDSLFAKSGYWHGNEPGHQIPFMYNYTTSPYKTQLAVRKILRDAYSDGPGGVDGNDDAGQMSAWYVFASMGFYPVDPVSGSYIVSSPIFDSISIQLGSGKMLSIQVQKSSNTAAFIEKIKLNGQTYDKNYFSKEIFQRGAQIQIWLTDVPTQWGNNARDQGPSLTK